MKPAVPRLPTISDRRTPRCPPRPLAMRHSRRRQQTRSSARHRRPIRHPRFLGYVHFLEGFFTANGIVGVQNPTTDQIVLAARAAAWGEGVAIALDNNLGSPRPADRPTSLKTRPRAPQSTRRHSRASRPPRRFKGQQLGRSPPRPAAFK